MSSGPSPSPLGYAPTREVREQTIERLRQSGVDKSTAHKLADDSLRRVEGRIDRGTYHRDQPPTDRK